jgi:hypothetical protein
VHHLSPSASSVGTIEVTGFLQNVKSTLHVTSLSSMSNRLSGSKYNEMPLPVDHQNLCMAFEKRIKISYN